jgi:hypothetical protein
MQTPLVQRQIRIFVPADLDNSCWVETVLGRVVKPVTEKFSPVWFWFSRYEEGRDGSNTDCEISKIPDSFRSAEDLYRSVRFRYCIPAAIQNNFEETTWSNMEASGFKASHFLNYPYIEDLASPRFLAEPRTEERQQRRADLHVSFLDATTKLFLDALTGPDDKGLYHVENNTKAFCNSSFTSVRHLLCNMTEAPTPIFVDEAGNILPHPSGEIQIIVPRKK